MYGAYAYGHSSGYYEGKEKGIETNQLQQLASELDSLKKAKSEEARDAKRVEDARKLVEE